MKRQRDQLEFSFIADVLQAKIQIENWTALNDCMNGTDAAGWLAAQSEFPRGIVLFIPLTGSHLSFKTDVRPAW
jgi:hypothetical protein